MSAEMYTSAWVGRSPIDRILRRQSAVKEWHSSCYRLKRIIIICIIERSGEVKFEKRGDKKFAS